MERSTQLACQAMCTSPGIDRAEQAEELLLATVVEALVRLGQQAR
jgi:hypothetical protein